MRDELINTAAAPADIEGATVEVVVRGPRVSRERAWALLGDTDWMNRLAGNGAVQQQAVTPAEDELPVIRGAISGPAGLRLPYTEVWTSWAWGEYFRQIRDLDTPVLRRTDYHARLLPRDGLVVPEVRLRLVVPRLLQRPIQWTQGRAIRQRWQAALDRLRQPPSASRALPASVRGALRRWESDVDPSLVGQIREHLEWARPTALQRMRAFALADRWGAPRDQVLEAMLYGVEAGVLELFWSVRCERCSGQLASLHALSDLPDHVDCPSCRIQNASDLGANVEALFTPHPSILPRIEERFCTLFPAGSPELHGVFTLAPGQRLRQSMTLPPGRWTLGPGGEVPDRDIQSRPGAPGDGVCWPGPDLQVVGAGPVIVQLHNDTGARVRVYLARVGTHQPQVLASYVTNHPTFRARMGHASLAPDLRLSVRAVSLIFTDLSGSTAMYEALGDAQAFAVVRDHFRVLRAAVADGGGTVIKTIGDAVMAAFPSPVEAAACALAMQADFEAWVQALAVSPKPKLKVGVHVGPALAVHSDVGGLDYFGSTVNVAARTEGCARGGDVILSAPIHDDPAVQVLLREKGLQPTPFEADLKGVAGLTRLFRVS